MCRAGKHLLNTQSEDRDGAGLSGALLSNSTLRRDRVMRLACASFRGIRYANPVEKRFNGIGKDSLLSSGPSTGGTFWGEGLGRLPGVGVPCVDCMGSH